MTAVDAETLGIAMVGYGFMGAVHSLAWRNAQAAFELPLGASLSAIAGRDEPALRAAAKRWGWASAETDWRRLLDRDDVAVIDICTPGDTHAEIAIAALEAGKHVLCEKPLANSVAQAEAMAAVAAKAASRGTRAMVGFNYRRVPALALARDLVATGRLGSIRHVRTAYLQDWLVDPGFPLTWRLRRERAGSGALGDLGAHIVDLAQFLTGDTISGVSALTDTFIAERPLPEGGQSRQWLSGAGTSKMGAVTVDDAAVFFGRFRGGALATFEATRMAPGRKNAMRIEVNGSAGSVSFDFESMNELWVYRTDDGAGAGTGTGGELSLGGFRRVLVTEPEHPYLAGWWPPGHGLGYDHTFANEMRDFIEAVHTGRDPLPSFAEGLSVQRVLDAVERSAANGAAWTPVAGDGADRSEAHPRHEAPKEAV